MTRAEALQAIKARMDYYESDKRLRCAIETIIPELTESEDERIKKYFIWIVKNVLNNIQGLKLSEEQTIELIDNYSGIKESDMIAWLEKQKEQEPITDSVKFEEGFKTGRESGLRDGQKYVLNNLDSYGLCKPAEWSEEDEKKIIFLERLIEHNVPDGQYGWVDGMKGGFVTKSEAISMLKSLRPSWKPSEVCYGPKGDPDPAGTSDLEEAADEYVSKTLCDPNDGPSTGLAKGGFIAGAEWQKMEAGRGYDSRDLYEAYEQGRFEQKEQMMKDAVDAEITVGRLPDDWSLAYNPDELHRALLKFKSGDKVKIIIVKQ